MDVPSGAGPDGGLAVPNGISPPEVDGWQAFRNWRRKMKENWLRFFRKGFEPFPSMLESPEPPIYAFFAIFLFGGFGLWLTLFLRFDGGAGERDVCLAILTYCCAVLSLSVLDLVWAQRPREVRIMALILLSVAVTGPIYIMWLLFRPSARFEELESPDGWTTATFVILSGLCWLYVNIGDSRFRIASDSAVGGNPMRDLEGGT